MSIKCLFAIAGLLLCGVACGDDSEEGNDGNGVSDESGSGDGGPTAEDASTASAADENVDAAVGADNAAHFHHAHLNTVDREATMEFYETFLAARRDTLEGRDVLRSGGALILMNEVEDPPDPTLNVSLEHIGFDMADVPAWYEEAESLGVPVDNRSVPFDGPLALTPTLHVIYIQGPSGERIEVETGEHEGLAHIHVVTPELQDTADWYAALLGQETETPMPMSVMLPNAQTGELIEWTHHLFVIDHVQFFLFGPPFPQAMQDFEDGSEGRPLDHVAFSFADLDPVMDRIDAMGLEVVRGPDVDDHGFRSMFVQGPHQTLIELVEAQQPAEP